MKIQISIPSKTYLLGEYVTLTGGPAIIINHEPYFQFTMTSGGSGECQGIHPHSPAGQLMRKNSAAFRDWNVEFRDPHVGQGGFGASTAQFLAIFLWQRLSHMQGFQRPLPLSELMSSYLEFAWDGEGVPPSGADLLAQWHGGLAYVQKNPLKVAALKWPFLDKTFLIARTGRKVTTHKHLKELSLTGLEDLKKYNQQGQDAVKAGNFSAFQQSLGHFWRAWEQTEWVCEETRELIKIISSWSEVLAAKGCGALAADTLLVVCDESQRSLVANKLEELGLPVVASATKVANGTLFEAAFGVNQSERVPSWTAEIL